MLGCVHNSTTIWRLWDPVRRPITQVSKDHFDKADTEADTAEANGNVYTTANVEAVYGSKFERPDSGYHAFQGWIG